MQRGKKAGSPKCSKPHHSPPGPSGMLPAPDVAESDPQSAFNTVDVPHGAQASSLPSTSPSSSPSSAASASGKSEAGAGAGAGGSSAGSYGCDEGQAHSGGSEPNPAVSSTEFAGSPMSVRGDSDDESESHQSEQAARNLPVSPSCGAPETSTTDLTSAPLPPSHASPSRISPSHASTSYASPPSESARNRVQVVCGHVLYPSCRRGRHQATPRKRHPGEIEPRPSRPPSPRPPLADSRTTPYRPSNSQSAVGPMSRSAWLRRRLLEGTQTLHRETAAALLPVGHGSLRTTPKRRPLPCLEEEGEGSVGRAISTVSRQLGSIDEESSPMSDFGLRSCPQGRQGKGRSLLPPSATSTFLETSTGVWHGQGRSALADCGGGSQGLPGRSFVVRDKKIAGLSLLGRGATVGSPWRHTMNKPSARRRLFDLVIPEEAPATPQEMEVDEKPLLSLDALSESPPPTSIPMVPDTAVPASSTLEPGAAAAAAGMTGGLVSPLWRPWKRPEPTPSPGKPGQEGRPREQSRPKRLKGHPTGRCPGSVESQGCGEATSQHFTFVSPKMSSTSSTQESSEQRSSDAAADNEKQKASDSAAEEHCH